MAHKPKQVEALEHDEAARKNIPPAELQALAQKVEETDPVEPVSYLRANPLAEGETRPRREGLDPQIVWSGGTLTLTDEQIEQLKETGQVEIGEAQLVWRGKDEQDWSDLVVHVPQIYLQEKIKPQAIIADLKRMSDERRQTETDAPDLFHQSFNGLDPEAKTEFYQHDMNWQNRMILGDSLQAMASLAEREDLRGKVQCIYFDPPYGIKFNSNWQVSTKAPKMADTDRQEEITREPEQVKAFRDTWKDGIHSYLTYLRDRLAVIRELLTESGSVFVQIGDENVHRVRAVMDEVFGEGNFVAEIDFVTSGGFPSNYLASVFDTILWYSKTKDTPKFRRLFREKVPGEPGATKYKPAGNFAALNDSIHDSGDFVDLDQITSQDEPSEPDMPFVLTGISIPCPKGLHWKTHQAGRKRLKAASRVYVQGKTPRYLRKLDDFIMTPIANVWGDIGGVQSRSDPKVYVVQTAAEAIKRCVLMTTDPGDLVLDPTCGSGTTATVAEQWGRRWITMDTSRVALARARIMGARYPYYHLADSAEGREITKKEFAELPLSAPPTNDIRQGFVYNRAPHITLKSIANNAEIDVIWDKWQRELEPLRHALNQARGRTGERASPADCGENGPWEEWEIPRRAADPWPQEVVKNHAKAIDNNKSDNVRGKALKAVNAAMGTDYTFDTLPDHADDPWENGAGERAKSEPGGQAAPAEASAQQAAMSANESRAVQLHREWWDARIARQQEIDKSIANKADVEFLYDRPFEDKSKVRVAGPFTVESLSPHRMISADEDDGAISAQLEVDEGRVTARKERPHHDFAQMVLENLQASGVQQAHKEDRITIDDIQGWPGDHICAKAIYDDGTAKRIAAIFIGPEFGTITRPDLIRAANEAVDMRADTLITCGFAYDAHTSELNNLGPVPILKARMNPDLHMAGDLKNTGSGNLFVVFGEPDLDWSFDDDGKIVVEVHGVDVFDPKKREVRASGKDGIAAWFIDTDYDSESFFVRHAYFMGANDPYKSLKTSLRDEIDEEAWASLYSDTSRPFSKPENGQFAVKVINHFGDEVMKVFRVE